MLGLIEVIRYYMSCNENGEHTDYSFVFHHCDIEETQEIETSALSLGPNLFPLIKINHKFITDKAPDNGQLKVKWGIEVLKHGLNHLLCGHAEQRVQNLVNVYGDKVVQAAADLIVNKYANEKVWKEVNVELTTPQSLGLPENETLEYYITRLLTKDPAKWPVPVGSFSQEFSQMDITDFLDHAQVEEKLRGTMPGDADEYIKQLRRPPQVDWDYYLRQKEGRHRGRIRVVDKRRLSRRCDHHFGRRTINSLSIAFIIDTSGSMSKEDLQIVEPEVEAIAERNAQIMIIHVDADVRNHFLYEPGMELAEYFGRGGTDFDPGFAKVKELEETGEFVADFVVYLTDGYGAVEDKTKEPIDTLWVLTKKGMEIPRFKNEVVPWGTVCKLRDNDCPSVAT